MAAGEDNPDNAPKRRRQTKAQKAKVAAQDAGARSNTPETGNGSAGTGEEAAEAAVAKERKRRGDLEFENQLAMAMQVQGPWPCPYDCTSCSDRHALGEQIVLYLPVKVYRVLCSPLLCYASLVADAWYPKQLGSGARPCTDFGATRA